MYVYIRPTQSVIHVQLLVNGFQKSILLILQYKYFKSCSEDFILQNLILRKRLCSTGFITQHSWLLHFRPTKMVVRKCFVPLMYKLARDRGDQPLNIFCMIHRGGRIYVCICIYIFMYMYVYTHIYMYI